MTTDASWTLATLYSMTRGISRHISSVVTWKHIYILVFHCSRREREQSVITRCVSAELTESRYRMTFPGCVSTFFMTSSVWTPSGGRLKPLSRPTSMMAMPVAFRPRPSYRLQGPNRGVRKIHVITCAGTEQVIRYKKYNYNFITTLLV